MKRVGDERDDGKNDERDDAVYRLLRDEKNRDRAEEWAREEFAIEDARSRVARELRERANDGDELAASAINALTGEEIREEFAAVDAAVRVADALRERGRDGDDLAQAVARLLDGIANTLHRTGRDPMLMATARDRIAIACDLLNDAETQLADVVWWEKAVSSPRLAVVRAVYRAAERWQPGRAKENRERCAAEAIALCDRLGATHSPLIDERLYSAALARDGNGKHGSFYRCALALMEAFDVDPPIESPGGSENPARQEQLRGEVSRWQRDKRLWKR